MTSNVIQPNHFKVSMFKNFKEFNNTHSDCNLSSTYRSTSLDSLANSSHNSDSTSIDSREHDSDSGTETQSKNSFLVKCDVHENSDKETLTSWTKTIESLKDRNSEISYEYVSIENSTKPSSEKRLDLNMARMETIPEEGAEPKISVKEILARFENLRDKKETGEKEQVQPQVFYEIITMQT